MLYVGDAVRTDDGKLGVIMYVRKRRDRYVYGVKHSPLFTPKDYAEWELELV